MNEKLSADDGIKAYIDDFKKSDAAQFKGKSDAKKKEMAIAAYLDAKKGPKKEAAPCWNGYKQVSMKKKGDRMVPNCMPESSAAFGDAQKKVVDKKKNASISAPDKNKLGKIADLMKKANEESEIHVRLDHLDGDKRQKKASDVMKKHEKAGHIKYSGSTDKGVIFKAKSKQHADRLHKELKPHATGVQHMNEDISALNELTAREKEMIAKRKASRAKKKMAPSTKAGKDAARDGAGRQGTKSSKPTVVNRLAGSGKSKRAADHIVMQLRKAQDVDGKMDIQVSPQGKKVRLTKKEIDALLRRHDSMQKPRDKRLFRVMLTRKLRQK